MRFSWNKFEKGLGRGLSFVSFGKVGWNRFLRFVLQKA